MTDNLTDDIVNDSQATGDDAVAEATNSAAAGEQTATPLPEVPELLEKISNRIGAPESDDTGGKDPLEGMRQRLKSLKQEAAANSKDTASKTIAPERQPAPENQPESPKAERLTSEGNTFSGVEAALARLAEHVDQQQPDAPVNPEPQAEAVPTPAVVEPVAEEPWTEDTAEQLTAVCEEAGLSTTAMDETAGAEADAAPVPSPAAADSPEGYVYLDAKQDDKAAVAAKPNEVPSELQPLLTKFETLEARIDAVLEQAPGSGATAGAASGSSMHDIELCIAEIAAQLETTTSEVSRIGGIEEQITEIAKELAAQRNAPVSSSEPGAPFDIAALADLVADKVAARPAITAAHEPAQAIAAPAGETNEISTVLNEFIRERRNEGEHANAVLDTMQQTIIRVLDRMEALEGAAPRAATPIPAAAPAPVQAASVQPAQPRASVDAGPSPSASPSLGAPAMPIEAPVPAPAADAASIDRLQRAVNELDSQEVGQDADMAPPAPAVAVTQPAAPVDKPAGNNIPNERADFIKAARQAATRANPPAEPQPEQPVANERARFAAAARKAAANANKRMMNDDVAELEIDATDDGFSLEGAAVPVRPAAKTNNRARLLVAAIALVAVGLVASKFMISTSSDAARVHLQSNRIQQSSSATAGTTSAQPAPAMVAPKLASVAPAETRQIVHDASASSQPSGTELGMSTFGVSENAVVQPVAIGPDANAQRPDQPASGGAGSVSRKTLPSALVGPLSLRLAAANGDASAEFQVASRFADGRGVKQDFAEATKWYRRAAARGFALAQYRLGTFYERGLGVTKDIQRAQVWYERAASHDNIKAMHNLAVLAASTTGGKPDYATAARWFTQAAERGLGDSQFNLAILYQNGLGVPKDEGMAYKWFKLAAAAGDAEAKRRKEELIKKIGTTRASQLDSEVRGWLRKPTDKLANDPHFAGQAWQRKKS